MILTLGVGAIIGMALPPGVLAFVAIVAAIGGAVATHTWATRQAQRQTATAGRAALFQSSGDSDPPPWIETVKINFEANPGQVVYPQGSLLTWSVVLPGGGSTLHVRLNGESVDLQGSRSVSPPRTRTYRLLVGGTHMGVYAETSQTVQVVVTYLPRVIIDPTTTEPVQVLLGALADSTNDQQTVELCRVHLDLTGHREIEIGPGRSLIASPDCARSPRDFGPRIFVTDEGGSKPLFVIRGDNVRFAGFRLEGPTSGVAQGDVKDIGIKVFPFEADVPIRNIEISNLEVFHWSGVGVQVGDNPKPGTRGRLFNTNPEAVRIRGCFFHHNRHGAGEGYGVEVNGGGYATIEQNVFDENRHGIAGGSVASHTPDFSGYTARDNLILEGGGRHCRDDAGTDAAIGGIIGGVLGGILGGILGGLSGGLPGAVVGVAVGSVVVGGLGAGIGGVVGSACWWTHQIDMHGDQNFWYSSHNWECGTAGETIKIERNTVLYTNGLAIKIRGNPRDKCVVDGNVFQHSSHSDAIGQNGECNFWGGDDISNPIDVRPNNQFGVHPLQELGSGDFFGDGKLEQFMATGVTWWARSPVTQQWRYLNTMSQRLPELLLAKVDSDSVCDVVLRPPNPDLPPTQYSKSGTGPWKPIPVIQG